MNKKNLCQNSDEHIVAAISAGAYIDAFDYAKELESHRNILNQKSEPVEDPKKDKWNFVFSTFFFYGISIGLPWNVFLPIINFFVSRRLADVNDQFEQIFLIVLLVIWQLTFFLTNLLNHVQCKTKKCDQRDRLPFVFGLSIFVTFGFIMFIVFNPNYHNKNWVYQFLLLMCLVAFINSAAGGILFSSAFYAAAMFPMNYTNSIIIGISTSSLFNNFITILYKEAPSNMAMYGITFFVLSLGCLIVTFIAHYSLNLSPFYNYHVELSKVKQIFTKSSHTIAYTSYSKVFLIIWPYLFCIWLLVFSTTIVYPNFQQKIISSTPNFFINEKWFTQITCDLTFNIMFLLGNLTGQFKYKPNSKWVISLTIIKSMLSLGFFIVCNFEPSQRQHIPILINIDYIYWGGSIILAYLSGYLLSLLMMCTPNQIKEHYSSGAALLSSLMIVIGILSGIHSSRLLEMVALI